MSNIKKVNKQSGLNLYRGDIIFCKSKNSMTYTGFNQRSMSHYLENSEPLRNFFGVVQGANDYNMYLITILGSPGHGVFVYVEAKDVSLVDGKGIPDALLPLVKAKKSPS